MIAIVAGACTPSTPTTDASKGPRAPAAHLVEIEIAARTPVRTATERTGTLKYRGVVQVHNQEEGRLIAVSKFEGDHFTKGERLVRIDDALLRAELDKARATTRQAKIDLKRIKRLAVKRAASEDELARAQTAVEIAEAEEQQLRTRLGYTQIHAPFAGLVTERKIEPGNIAPKHTLLLTIVDPASLVIELPISELLLPLVAIGDPAQVRIDALGGHVHQGEVQRIHPQLDAFTRQGIVEIALDPIPSGARAGQFARVTLTTALVDRLLVPFAAVRRDRSGEFVYVLVDGKAQQRAVRSGQRVKDRVEILQGIEPGDRIVSRGFLGLTPDKTVVLSNRPLDNSPEIPLAAARP